MNHLINLFQEWKQGLIYVIIVILLLVMLTCIYPPYPGAEIIHGLSILATALLTAKFAFKQYKDKQITLRLQKIYFEDTLLGLAKSIEKIRSKTKGNLLLMENVVNLANHISGLKHVDIADKKSDMLDFFISSSRKIDADFNTTDFKKYTLSDLLLEPPINNHNMLSAWIDQFEEDSFRFANFLQSQMLTHKALLTKLNDSNLKNFQKSVHSLHTWVKENYTLIQRHDILFILLSKVVLEFISADYTTIILIRDTFRSEKFIKIIQLINEAYKEVIINFEHIGITNISPEEAFELTKRIEISIKKLHG